MILDGYVIPGVKNDVVDSTFSNYIKSLEQKNCVKITDEICGIEGLYENYLSYASPQLFTENLLMGNFPKKFDFQVESSDDITKKFDFLFDVPPHHYQEDDFEGKEKMNRANDTFFHSIEYEWVRTFLTHIGYLVIDLSDSCHCKVMSGKGTVIYSCTAHEGRRSNCSAIDNCTHTMDITTSVLVNTSYFPDRRSVGVMSHSTMGTLCRRLHRIFIHAFFHHRDVFDLYEGSDSEESASSSDGRGSGSSLHEDECKHEQEANREQLGAGNRKGYRLYSKFASFCRVHQFMTNPKGINEFELIIPHLKKK